MVTDVFFVVCYLLRWLVVSLVVWLFRLLVVVVVVVAVAVAVAVAVVVF